MRYGRKKCVVLRRGMTLIELLVVVTIIMLLAAMTIPRLRPEMDRSRVREAARSIQLYLSSARNLAISTGRSCGVQIERLPAENGCSMSLTQVETPLPYGGDLSNSSGTIALSQNPGPKPGYAYCKINLSSAPSVPLYPGDLIQVGYQGFWITLDTRNPLYPNPPNGSTPPGWAGAISSGASLMGYMDITHGETPPWAVQPISGSFKIIRQPVKSIASALQLPSPAVIDLTWSGIGSLAGSPDPPPWDIPPQPPNPMFLSPVTIMFSPNGSVDMVYRYVAASSSYSATRVTSPIYLLVGSRQNVIDPPNPSNTSTNLNNISNLWVAINAGTGLITVTDMASTNTGTATTIADLYPSRVFARQSSAMGGK